VSLNNDRICCEISEDKIAVGEKIAGLRSGNFSDLTSACSKVLVPVKIFQFEDMGIFWALFEVTANGLSVILKICKIFLLTKSFISDHTIQTVLEQVGNSLRTSEWNN
jgi:hypothetical protein